MTPSCFLQRAFTLAFLVSFGGTLAAQRPDISSTLPRTHTPTPTTTDITVADVMTREYIIADDSMEGRDTGKRGGLRSATYIATELRRLGLEPAGDAGTYFQRIPWTSRAPDSAAILNAGTATLRWGTDFLLLPKVGFALALGGQPFGAAFDASSTPVVFGGRIGEQMIDSSLVNGKIIVIAPPADRPGFAFWQRDNLRRYRSAAAIVIATLDLGAPAAYKRTLDTFWDSASVSGARPMTVLSVTNASVTAIFGRSLAELHVGDAGTALSGDVRFIDRPTEAPAYNVVAIARGTDARLRNTYVAVGAHHDHVGMGPAVDHDSIRAFNYVVRPRGADDPPPRQVTDSQWIAIRALLERLRAINPPRRDSIFNGADDDGSGSVLALEIAEWFAATKNRPARSIVFVFHTAEERGLYGSQYFSDHPTVPRDSIVAQINMDQMGRGEASDKPAGGENALVVIGPRRLSTELGDLAESIDKRPEYGFRFDYQFDKDGDPTRAYCRSDHYMYARYGIPVVFFVAAAWYLDYHMVSDEPQYVQYDRMTKIGRYIRDMVGATANLTHRPVVDKAKPDPDGVCVQ